MLLILIFSISLRSNREFITLWLRIELLLFLIIVTFFLFQTNLYFIIIFFLIQSFRSMAMLFFLGLIVKYNFYIIVFFILIIKSSLFPFFWIITLRGLINWLTLVVSRSIPKLISLTMLNIFFFNFNLLDKNFLFLLGFNSLMVIYLVKENRMIKIITISRIFNLFIIFLLFNVYKIIRALYLFIYIWTSITIIFLIKSRNKIFLNCLKKINFNRNINLIYAFLMFISLPPFVLFLFKLIFYLTLIEKIGIIFLFILIILRDSYLSYIYMLIFIKILINNFFLNKKNIIKEYLPLNIIFNANFVRSLAVINIW